MPLPIVTMAVSVTLVAITNQKYYGRRSFGLSLIGPRMSTVSLGWTLIQYVYVTMRQQSTFSMDRQADLPLCYTYSLCFAGLSQAVFPDTM